MVRLIGDKGNPALLDLDFRILKEFIDSFKKIRRATSLTIGIMPLFIRLSLFYAGTPTISFGPKGVIFMELMNGWV